MMQSHITLMLDRRPKDNDAPTWYEAARTVALTHAANKAFQLPRATAMSSPQFTSIHRAGKSQTKFAMPPAMNPAAMLMHIAPAASLGPAPMDVDATKRQFT